MVSIPYFYRREELVYIERKAKRPMPVLCPLQAEQKKVIHLFKTHMIQANHKESTVNQSIKHSIEAVGRMAYIIFPANPLSSIPASLCPLVG